MQKMTLKSVVFCYNAYNSNPDPPISPHLITDVFEIIRVFIINCLLSQGILPLFRDVQMVKI